MIDNGVGGTKNAAAQFACGVVEGKVTHDIIAAAGLAVTSKKGQD